MPAPKNLPPKLDNVAEGVDFKSRRNIMPFITKHLAQKN